MCGEPSISPLLRQRPTLLSPQSDGMTDVHAAGRPDSSAGNIVKSSLKCGVFTGGVGFLFGGTSGILKGTTPFLFATASGIQTFALGTTFWATRSGVLQAWDTGHLTPGDYTKASTAAGGLSGAAIALLTRGRSNVIPASLMWSLSGCLGQVAMNSYAAPRETPKDPFWKRVADKKWSPVSYFSNDDYAKMLREKMMKLDVEIAIIDDKIAALREREQQDSAANAAQATQKPSNLP